MPGPLSKLRRRVDQTAAGSQPPAGTEVMPAGPHRAGPREKLALRRRLRELRDARHRLIFELGALTFEQYRRNRPDGALLGRKAGEAVAVDTEMATLAGALGKRRQAITLPIDGVARPCEHCGHVVTGDAHFCSACGSALAPESAFPAAASEPAAPVPPAAPAAPVPSSTLPAPPPAPVEQPAPAPASVEQVPPAAEQPAPVEEPTGTEEPAESTQPTANGGARFPVEPQSPAGPQSPAEPSPARG